MQYFCKSITDEKLLVIQEYREAMDTFISEDETYEAGACILGQPGIGRIHQRPAQLDLNP